MTLLAASIAVAAQTAGDRQFYQQALQRFLNDDFRGSILDFEELRRRTGQDEVLYYIGYAHLKLGDYAQAEAKLAAALEVLPESWEVHLGLAKALYHSGKHAEARRHFGRVIEMQEENLDAYFHLGLLDAAAGLHSAALGRFERVLTIDPYHLGALYNAAQTYIRLKDMQKAREYLARHQELVPKFDRIESLQKAASLPSSTAHNWLSLGNALLEVANYQKAMDAYRKAGQKDPELDIVHYHLGFAAYRLGDFEGSIASYSQFLASRPGHFQSLFNLGHALKKAGKTEPAIEAFEKAALAMPADPLPLVALTEIPIESQAWTEAIRRAQLLTAKFPDYAHGFFLLGHSLLQAGRPADAVAPARRAIEQEARSVPQAESRQRKAAYHTLLGQIFESLGQKENARREYQRAKNP